MDCSRHLESLEIAVSCIVVVSEAGVTEKSLALAPAAPQREVSGQRTPSPSPYHS
ncbi:unnamed protein product [marine sediment metagenome]|uniref:Uncharacterized protein n=1 Tax=marine sediment metagenome TaxID=412755 RepID=X1TT83_9ZZZZ